MKKLNKRQQQLKDLGLWLVKNKPLYTNWCECSFCKFYRKDQTRLEEATSYKK